MNNIYLDNAATTRVDDEVFVSYCQLIKDMYYNADSLYSQGATVNKYIEQARERIANLLCVSSKEIIFTSGSSEGNNFIIRGLVDYYHNPKKRLITTCVEHSSVYNVFKYYEQLGYDVIYLDVDKDGVLDYHQLEKALNDDTLLVSIMAVNNEVGTIFDLNKINEIVRSKSKAYIHCDGTQALGKIDIDLSLVDFASFSMHKINGLKGSGFVYKKNNINLVPLIIGGQQEFGYRGGTSNAPCIIVMAKTLRLILEKKKRLTSYIQELHDYAIERLLSMDKVHINSKNSSNFIINFYLEDISSQVLINALDARGIYISGKSTCSSKKKEDSKVLIAMGFSELAAHNSVRISFDYHSSKKDIDILVNNLLEIRGLYAK
ncbi:MAG: cysteine desulfurase family protein [Erysipelotrichaceae bacterium]